MNEEPLLFWDVLFFALSICIGRLVAHNFSGTSQRNAHHMQLWYRKIQHYIYLLYGIVTGTSSPEYCNFTKSEVRWTLTSAHIDMIASRKWKDLLVWIVFHPEELLSVDKRNQTVLHHACLFRSPAQIIQMLLYQKPELAQIQNIDDEIPLHWAIRLSAPNEVIKLLLSVHPSSACSIKDKDGNTALSMVWERCESSLLDSWWQSGQQSVISNNGWTSIFFFFQCYSYYLKTLSCHDVNLDEDTSLQLERIEDHSKQFRPLHTATQCPSCPLMLYTLLLRVYKDRTREQDDHGRVPLSVACLNPISNRSIGVLTKVHLLLAEYPPTSDVIDDEGRIPLFSALESSLTWDEGIDRLIAVHPKSLLLCDPVTRLPAFLLAASHSHTQSEARDTSSWHAGGNNVSTSNDEQQQFWDQAHLSTIFSILRKDPAQMYVTSCIT